MLIGLLDCPSWCTEHRGPDPTEPGDGGSHHGPRVPLPVEIPPHSPHAESFVQLAAHDHDGVRLELIDLVLHDTTIEMTPPQAASAVRILTHGAQLREKPDRGICPAWCLHHRRPDSDTDELVHYGPDSSIPVYGPRTRDSRLGVRLTALGTEQGCESFLDLVVEDIPTILTAAEARGIADRITAQHQRLAGSHG